MLFGETTRVHDPSRVIECEGKFYLYSTGDLIPSRVSSDLLHWEKGPTALTSLPAWLHQKVPLAQGQNLWAPDVIRVGDQYWLFYSYSTFGSRTSVIGLLVNSTLDPQNPCYKWADKGPIVATDGTQNYNAIDPAPILTRGGELWLSFGSWWNGIQIVRLDKASGQPVGPPKTIAAGQRLGPEAAYLYEREGNFYLFENEGDCCRGMNSTYRIMIGRSPSVSGPFLDRDGQDLARGGGTVFLRTEGATIGPGHVGIVERGGLDYLTFHFYDGQNDGTPTLGMRNLTWDAQNWPLAAPDLAGGRYALINAASGLALGVRDSSLEDGARLDQFAFGGGDAQIWNAVPLKDGFYALQSQNSGKYLNLPAHSRQDGAPVFQQAWENSDGQRWRIEALGDGYYRLTNKADQGALSVERDDKAPRALVENRAWNGSAGQKWKFQMLP